MNPFETTTNVTTQFILPMIYEDNVTYKKISKKSFISSYVSDYEIPDWDDKIIVIYSKENEPENTRNPYISKYKVNDNFVYIYDMLEEDIDKYYLILDNNYSLLDVKYKTKLLHFWDQIHNFGSSLIHYVLFREMYNNLSLKQIRDLDLQLKEMDAKYPIFIPDNEIYWRK